MKKTITLILILFLTMGFSIFNKQSKEDKFWSWFTKNQETYYKEIENLDVREKIFNKLSSELKKVNKELVFEFSPIHDNGIREFTISADGIKDVFPSVIKLVEKAPALEKWKFNSFRQRIPGNEMELDFGGFKIGYNDIYFRHTDDDGKLGIELNIRDFNGEPQKQNAVYILLDNLIGEFDVTTEIGWIDWVKLDEKNIETLNPLISLRSVVDQRKKN